MKNDIIKIYDFSKPSKKIDNFIESIGKSWLKKSQNIPSLLYHYTNAMGLKGIIENRSLWFTRIDFLNDPIEFNYGKSIIINQLESFVCSERDEQIRRILKETCELVEGTIPGRIHVPFISCFSEEGNLLSQWRAYSDKCSGYSLGFDFTNEIKFCSDSNTVDKFNSYLRKVIYDKKEQNELIKNIIQDYCSVIKSLVNLDKQDEGRISDKIINTLYDIMLSFKEPAFHEEKEWRLIRVLLCDEKEEYYKFREVNNLLVPYHETFIFNEYNGKKEFPLKEIYFGPMLDKNSTKTSLEAFIRNSSAKVTDIGIRDKIQIKEPGYTIRF